MPATKGTSKTSRSTKSSAPLFFNVFFVGGGGYRFSSSALILIVQRHSGYSPALYNLLFYQRDYHTNRLSYLTKNACYVWLEVEQLTNLTLPFIHRGHVGT